jgi:hypothetical protein
VTVSLVAIGCCIEGMILTGSMITVVVLSQMAQLHFNDLSILHYLHHNMPAAACYKTCVVCLLTIFKGVFYVW